MTDDDLLDDRVGTFVALALYMVTVLGFLLFFTVPGQAALDGMARISDVLTGGVC